MFSVIIPTCSRPRMLESTLASALAQELSGLEVIVVGDGASLAVARALGDDRILCVDDGGPGLVQACNAGVKLASRPFIAILHGQDRWQDRQHLARARHRLSEDAGFWFSDGELIVGGSPELRLPFAFGADARSLECSNTIASSAFAYRRELHDRLGPFDETLPYSWDWDWYLRVARSGAILAHDTLRSVAIGTQGDETAGRRASLERRAELDRFAAKHRLPRLDLKNHLSIAVAAMA